MLVPFGNNSGYIGSINSMLFPGNGIHQTVGTYSVNQARDAVRMDIDGLNRIIGEKHMGATGFLQGMENMRETADGTYN